MQHVLGVMRSMEEDAPLYDGLALLTGVVVMS